MGSIELARLSQTKQLQYMITEINNTNSWQHIVAISLYWDLLLNLPTLNKKYFQLRRWEINSINKSWYDNTCIDILIFVQGYNLLLQLMLVHPIVIWYSFWYFIICCMFLVSISHEWTYCYDWFSLTWFVDLAIQLYQLDGILYLLACLSNI